MTLKKIVAATDLSASSRHATDRAAQLAQAQGAQLTLAHVLEEGLLDELRQWMGGSEHAQGLEQNSRERLHACADDLHARFGADVVEQLLLGQPLQQLMHLVEDVQADLLVTGTRGAGFVRGAMLGSTAERLAHRVTRPVLMARQPVHGAYRRVLLPVDFSPWSLQAIRLAAQIAPGVPLLLMHAVKVPFETRMRMAGVTDVDLLRYRDAALTHARQELQRLADASGVAPALLRLLTPYGAEPWMLIAQAEQEHDCDLVVIGRQGRNAVADLVLGSTTRMVLAECASDVLVSVHQ